jgi:hypothetical protein
MVSEENLEHLALMQIKYISAMDRSQVESISGINFGRYARLTIATVGKQNFTLSGFKRLNEVTLYREIKVEGKRRYILCFNPQLFKDQRGSRAQAIEDFKAYVEGMNEEFCRER